MTFEQAQEFLPLGRYAFGIPRAVTQGEHTSIKRDIPSNVSYMGLIVELSELIHQDARRLLAGYYSNHRSLP